MYLDKDGIRRILVSNDIRHLVAVLPPYDSEIGVRCPSDYGTHYPSWDNWNQHSQSCGCVFQRLTNAIYEAQDNRRRQW